MKKNIFSGETARSRSSQMDTSSRSTALGSRSISSHRSQSSSMLLPTDDMETNKHKVGLCFFDLTKAVDLSLHYLIFLYSFRIYQ